MSTVEGREVPALKQELESPCLYPREWYDHKAKSCLGFPIWLVAIGRQGSRPLVCVSTPLLQSTFQGLTSSQASQNSERAIYLFLNGTQVPLQIWSLHFPLDFPMKKNAWKGVVCSFLVKVLKQDHLETVLN